MTKSASARHTLKYQLFQRDGWQTEDGKWHALCAFGCGDELVWTTATIDRYPIMGKDGGKYVLENTRLACKPCNSRNRNHKVITAKDRRKAELREKNRKKWEEFRKRQEESDAEKQKRKQRNRAIHNEPRPDLSSFRALGYSQEIKKKPRENYPKSADIDRNEIPIDVVWDNQKGKFRYER